MTSTPNRTAGLAAILFATAIVATNLVVVPAGLPRTGADTGTVTTFFATHGSAVGLSVALGPVAWVAAVLFGAGVVTALRGRVAAHGLMWALAGFGGLLLQNATFTGVVALRLALTATAGEAAPVLWPLHDALFTLNGTFLALALVGLTIAGRSAGLLRRWHATLGFTAALLLVGSATLAAAIVRHEGPLGLLGLAGWILWVVWLVAYGVALLRDDGRDQRSALAA